MSTTRRPTGEPNEQLPASEFDYPLPRPAYLDYRALKAKLDHIKRLYREIYGADVSEPITAAEAVRDSSTSVGMETALVGTPEQVGGS